MKASIKAVLTALPASENIMPFRLQAQILLLIRLFKQYRSQICINTLIFNGQIDGGIQYFKTIT